MNSTSLATLQVANRSIFVLYFIYNNNKNAKQLTRRLDLDEVIDALTTYVDESLHPSQAHSVSASSLSSTRKERRFKGITLGEYMACLAKMAVNKLNKSKLVECGILGTIKSIVVASDMSDNFAQSDVNTTLTCLWNLCFDEQVTLVDTMHTHILAFYTNIFVFR